MYFDLGNVLRYLGHYNKITCFSSAPHRIARVGGRAGFLIISFFGEGMFSGIGGIVEMAEIAKLLYQTTQEHYTLVVGRSCS